MRARRPLPAWIHYTQHAGKRETLSARGQALRGTAMTNLSQKSEALGVVGHTPKGTGTVSPSEQLSQSTTPQVLVVSPTTLYYLLPIVHGHLQLCLYARKMSVFNSVLTVESSNKKECLPSALDRGHLDTLAGSRWFSTLDLLSEYWQVEIAQSDKEKTAFCVPDGLLSFNAMPFGLCNAPTIYQRHMDTVLAGLQWERCLVYPHLTITLQPSAKC